MHWGQRGPSGCRRCGDSNGEGAQPLPCSAKRTSRLAPVSCLGDSFACPCLHRTSLAPPQAFLPACLPPRAFVCRTSGCRPGRTTGACSCAGSAGASRTTCEGEGCVKGDDCWKYLWSLRREWLLCGLGPYFRRSHLAGPRCCVMTSDWALIEGLRSFGPRGVSRSTP